MTPDVPPQVPGAEQRAPRLPAVRYTGPAGLPRPGVPEDRTGLVSGSPRTAGGCNRPGSGARPGRPQPRPRRPENVTAKLVQHPGHIVAAERLPPVAMPLAQASHSSSGSPAPRPPRQRGQQDPGRPRQGSGIRYRFRLRAGTSGQVGVERLLDRVADLFLPAGRGGVHRGRPQLVGHQPGQQERPAAGASSSQVAADRSASIRGLHACQPPGDVARTVPPPRSSAAGSSRSSSASPAASTSSSDGSVSPRRSSRVDTITTA